MRAHGIKFEAYPIWRLILGIAGLVFVLSIIV
jgi:hypothetical protein